LLKINVPGTSRQSRVAEGVTGLMSKNGAVPRRFAALFGAFTAGCAGMGPAELPVAPESVSALQVEAETQALRHPRLPPLSVDLSGPLTPEQLGVVAVVASPALKAARAQAGLAEAQAFEAGLLPDPQFSFGLDRPLSTPGAVTALAASLGLDLPALYARGPARRAASRRAEQARLDVAWQEWQTAFQARLLAARIVGLTRSAALSESARRSAEALLEATLRAVARGDLNANDLEARRIAASDTAERSRTAERDLDAARQDLNRLLGLPPETVLDLAPTKFVDRAAAPAGELFAVARSARLDLLALQAGYAAQEAAVRGAVLGRYPRLNLTVNAARDTGGVRTVGPAVAFDLPLFNRNRGAVAVAVATRAQLRAEYDARLFETRADIAALVNAYEIGRRQRRDLVAQIAPLRDLVQAFERAADRGDVAQVTAVAARQSLFDKEIALVGLEQSLSEQRAALELATGRLWDGER
jgi:outer membrane protein, heavy metal efflux system